jgi:hypothetical protein
VGTDGSQGSPLFLKSTAVDGFIAVHEGSTTDRVKSQPVLELFVQEKYSWIGDVKGMFPVMGAHFGSS